MKAAKPMTVAAIVTANAVAGPAVASSNATSAGPSVKLNSIITESTAKASRRSSSWSKRCRQSVRVSTVIGAAKRPAMIAKVITGA